jgi:hypothetical protein
MEYAPSNDLIIVFPQSNKEVCCWANTPNFNNDENALTSDGLVPRFMKALYERLGEPRKYCDDDRNAIDFNP